MHSFSGGLVEVFSLVTLDTHAVSVVLGLEVTAVGVVPQHLLHNLVVPHLVVLFLVVSRFWCLEKTWVGLNNHLGHIVKHP